MTRRFWPLGAGRIVTSPFGPRRGGHHFGTDFGRVGGSAGMPVYAVADGTVIHAGAAQGYGGPDPAGWLVIDHPADGGGGCSEYGHIIREVGRGDRVRAGQRIGRINPDRDTNGGTDPHLHLSVMPREYNPAAKIDPIPWLGRALEPGTEGPPVAKIWTGRATWLADVLSPALGNRLVVVPGWEARGHGDFKDIRGLMAHHTGSSAATMASIRDGRPDLKGPLSNWLIGRDGKVHLIAAGVCWHAGQGSYPWLPTNMGNWHLLGGEYAWPTIINGRYDEREEWPPAQIVSMRDTHAAVTKFLGYLQDRNIGHKEYAGRAQGKWDPGNIDMGWFRGEIRKDMDGFVFPGETPGVPLPPGTPLPIINPVITPPGAWASILLYRGMPGPNAQVRELQRRLKAAYASYADHLAADGWFGPATETAVREFQRRSRLAPDGVVGPMTAAALNLKVV